MSGAEVAAVVVAAGKASAGARAVKSAIRVVGKIWSTINSARSQVAIENQELTLRVPEKIGQYSVALRLNRGPAGHPQKIRFPMAGITRVIVHALDRAYLPQPQAIIKTADGCEFDSSKLAEGIVSILVTFDFQIEDNLLLESLVERTWTHDSAEDESSKVSEYWMSAQLRHPSVLKTNYGKLDLKGLDMRVDVGVSQDVKTKIPKPFSRHMEIISRWVGTRDRNIAMRLSIQKSREARYAGKENDLVQQLQDLFVPTEFKRYIDVNNPFHYDNCYRGAELYEIPMFTVPKEMSVVSRTDLTLDEPAHNGKLLYRKGELHDAIAKIFGEK